MTDTIEHYQQLFNQHEKQLVGADVKWLQDSRQQAMQAFCEHGFPTTRQEDWKYTNTKSLTRYQFRFIDDASQDVSEWFDTHPLTLECYQIAFVDGRFSPEHSQLADLPKNVIVENLATTLADTPELMTDLFHDEDSISSFDKLNHAFFDDGLFIKVSDNTQCDKPIRVVMLSTQHDTEVMSHLRNFILLGTHAEANIIMEYHSLTEATHFNTYVNEVYLDDNAHLQLHTLQNTTTQAYLVTQTQIYQSDHSRLTHHHFDFGGQLVRHDINTQLLGPGAHCDLNGVYMPSGKQHIDNHTCIEHQSAHTTSKQFYKGILADRSRGVFNGQVFVQEQAQKVDAQQQNKNLLLSDKAEIDTKPQLEIYADDVKCAHGATIGQLDEDSIFYLLSRGIELDKAKDILSFGFAHEMLNYINHESIQQYISQTMLKKFDSGNYIESLL